MTFLGRFRRRQTVATRWVTALFAVAWIGLAIQPCSAMQSHGDAGTSQHAGATGEAAHDCPHCPPPAAPQNDPPCGSTLSCDAVGPPALPSKATDAQPADFPLLVSLLDLAPGVGPGPVPVRPPRLTQRWTPSSSPQQRFCSFLK